MQKLLPPMFAAAHRSRFWCVTPSDVAPTTENICSDNEPVAATANDQNPHQQQQPTQAKPIWAQQNAVLQHNPTACYLLHEARSSNYLGPGQTRLDLLHDGKEFPALDAQNCCRTWTRPTPKPESPKGFQRTRKAGSFPLGGFACPTNQIVKVSPVLFLSWLKQEQRKFIVFISN